MRGTAGIEWLWSRSAWLPLIIAGSAVGGLAAARFRPSGGGAVAVVVWSCASLSLLWAICGAVAKLLDRELLDGESVLGPPVHGEKGFSAKRFVSASHVGALLFGVTAAIVQCVVLLMRLIYVGVDLVNGFPWRGARGYGFDAQGLWSLGLIFTSCAVTLLSTGNPGLFTCQLWCTVMIGVWACLLLPAFSLNAAGVFQPTGSTLTLVACLSALLTVASLLGIWLERRHRARGESVCTDIRFGREASWPGFRVSCGVIAAVIVLLASYHLAVPVPAGRGGFRMGALALTGATVLAAYSTLSLAVRSRSGPLTDAGFGLVTLSLCGLATMFVPSEPASLSARYPLLFNAMIVGCTVAGGGWALLWTLCRRLTGDDGWHGQAQLAREGLPSAGESHGQTSLPMAPTRSSAPKITGNRRLASHARRAAFLSIALALVLAALMATWPRLPSIAAMDDSLGRITVGLAANLFLLLITLRIARWLRQPTFHVLWVMALLSTVGFLLIRLLPFTSRYG